MRGASLSLPPFCAINCCNCVVSFAPLACKVGDRRNLLDPLHLHLLLLKRPSAKHPLLLSSKRTSASPWPNC